MNKFFNTISIFVVIAILSLLTACPVDNAPSEKKDAKAPVFDIKVINKAVSGLEQDLTADLINGFIMKKIGDISFNAFSTQFYAKCDNTTTSKSGYDGYFFYLENKIYFEDTTDKIFYYQELNNLNETIYYKNSVSIFKMMEENEYKTAKKELTEASLPILKPMMKEVDGALGKTTYKINVNSINDIEITAFKKTFKLSGLDGNQQSTCSWIQVLLAYCFNKDIDLLSSLKASTDLSSYFTDYPNINNFYNALQDEVKKFSD